MREKPPPGLILKFWYPVDLFVGLSTCTILYTLGIRVENTLNLNGLRQF